MKKTITSLLVGIMVFGMLSGCGNTSRVQEDLEEMGFTEEVVEETTVEETAVEEIVVDVPEEKPLIPHEYEPTSTIMNTNPTKESIVQIGDMIMSPGGPLKEIMEIIADSKIEWTYDYNPDKLITPDEKVPLKILYNGDTYFTVEAMNLYLDGKTRALSDCTVVNFKFFDEEWIKNNVFLFGGMSSKTIDMTYDEVQEFMEGYCLEYVSENTSGKYIYMTYMIPEDIWFNTDYTSITGDDFLVSLCPSEYTIMIDSELGKVSAINYPESHEYKVYTASDHKAASIRNNKFCYMDLEWDFSNRDLTWENVLTIFEESMLGTFYWEPSYKDVEDDIILEPNGKYTITMTLTEAIKGYAPIEISIVVGNPTEESIKLNKAIVIDTSYIFLADKPVQTEEKVAEETETVEEE